MISCSIIVIMLQLTGITPISSENTRRKQRSNFNLIIYISMAKVEVGEGKIDTKKFDN